MTITILNSGPGGSTGAYIATAAPYYSSGTVWYVDSTIGTDAAGAAGQNREKPLATLAQAITNASAGDLVVLGANHVEAYTAGTSLYSKALIIAGEGSSAGIPTATLTFHAGAVSFSAANVELHNVKIAARTSSNSTARISIDSSNCALRGCYIECAVNDIGPGVNVATGLNNITLDSCTWISTATASASQPESGLKTAGTVSDMLITDCVFSDGAYGFSNFFAANLSAGAITRLEMRRLSLLLGADLKLNASTTFRLAGLTATGGGKLVY